MPSGDRTGPAGWGPMTGRRRGYCAGYNAPGFVSPGPGMGYGRGGGRGLGRGWGRGYPAYGPEVMTVPPPVYAPRLDPEEERRYLEQCSEQLEADLEDIKKRIKHLEEDKEE